MDKEKFKKIVESSTNKTQILQKLGLRAAGGNFKTLDKYIKLWNINTDHFNNKSQLKGLKLHQELMLIPLEKILIENSTYSRKNLKKRLYDLGIKKRNCELCNQGEMWNGKKMSLILDHINGIWDDNRLENLRIICPNCNGTLDTHAGKNIKRSPKEKIKKLRPTKIIWPSKEELEKMVWEKPSSLVAKELGVSDVAISKRCKKLGIKKPERGYWEKIHHSKNE